MARRSTEVACCTHASSVERLGTSRRLPDRSGQPLIALAPRAGASVVRAIGRSGGEGGLAEECAHGRCHPVPDGETRSGLRARERSFDRMTAYAGRIVEAYRKI